MYICIVSKSQERVNYLGPDIKIGLVTPLTRRLYESSDTPHIKINIQTLINSWYMKLLTICSQVHNHSNFLVLLGQTLFLHRDIIISNIRKRLISLMVLILQAIIPWYKNTVARRISNFRLVKTFRIHIRSL